jgi:hypothetical protein
VGRSLPALAIALFALVGWVDAQPAIARFTLRERFGVAQPDQPTEFSYAGGRIDRRSTRMLGPGGEDVPYQQLSTGNILISTALPPSRIGTVYSPIQVNPTADTVAINLNMLGGAYPSSGDAVQFSGTDVPRGLLAGVNYFLRKTSNGGVYTLSRSEDLSGTIDITSSGNAVTIHKQGWIVDPDDPGHTLYARGHGYRTGDPIRLKSSGVLPSPLVANQTYFVIRTSENTFQLAASRDAALSGLKKACLCRVAPRRELRLAAGLLDKCCHI